MGDNVEVLAAPCRAEIAHRRAAAAAVARGGLEIADALLVRAVEVLPAGQATFHAGPDEGFAEFVRFARIGNGKRPTGAVERVRTVLLVLGPLEIGQHIREGPTGIAHPGPMVEVLLLAADIDESVD